MREAERGVRVVRNEQSAVYGDGAHEKSNNSVILSRDFAELKIEEHLERKEPWLEGKREEPQECNEITLIGFRDVLPHKICTETFQI